MIPIYLFNASPWGSLTKGYRLLNPSSQREMREKNPYHVQRWRVFLSLCIIHASWSPPTANTRIVANTRERAHIQRSEDAAVHSEKRGGRNLISICRRAASTSAQTICFAKRIGLHLYPSVLIVLLHKSKEGVGGGGKTKTKQRDVASGLGIFLLPRKGCAINNRGRKQPGGAQRQNCSTSC